MRDTIYRQDAIDALWKALHDYEDKTEKQFQESKELDVWDWIQHRIFVQNMNDIDRQAILELPSAQPETSIMTVTVKPDELVGFAEWVLDEIWDEELWEYNWQGFPELVCRKLLKLGFVTTNEGGNYERNE